MSLGEDDNMGCGEKHCGRKALHCLMPMEKSPTAFWQTMEKSPTTPKVVYK